MVASLRDLQPGQALGALQTLSMAGRLAPHLFAKYAQGTADFVLEDMLVMAPEGLSQLDSQGLPAALESSSEWAEVHPGIRIKMRAVKVGMSVPDAANLMPASGCLVQILRAQLDVSACAGMWVRFQGSPHP